VQHEGNLSLAAAGITLGDTYSILLRLRGGVGDKETAAPPAADTRPAATSAILQPPPPPPDGHADGGSSSIANGFEAEDVEDRMRAESDTAGAQADHDMSRLVYAHESIGAHVENPHSVVISSFQDAQIQDREASTNWWCACDAEQDSQGLRFTVNYSGVEWHAAKSS